MVIRVKIALMVCPLGMPAGGSNPAGCGNPAMMPFREASQQRLVCVVVIAVDVVRVVRYL